MNTCVSINLILSLKLDKKTGFSPEENPVLLNYSAGTTAPL